MGSRHSANAAPELKEDLADHESSINCMALSDDRSMLVTGSEDGTARMWSARTMSAEALGVFKGHTGYISAVGVHDMYVITASADCTMRKWDMTTCECLFIYEGHTGRIQKLLVTGHFIFSSAHDKTARAWLFDVSQIAAGRENEALIRTFRGHEKPVYPLIFIPAADFDPTDGATINAGDMLITGSADHTARSWSFDTGGCIKTYQGHTAAITCMATDPTGRILFTAGADTTIKAWNVASAKLYRTMEGHYGAITCLVMCKGLLYTGSADGTARCWVTDFGDCTRVFKGHNHSVICIKFDKGLVISGCGDGYVRAYDAKSGALRKSYRGHKGAVNCLSIVGTKVFSGSSDSTLKIWDIADICEEIDLSDEPPLMATGPATMAAMSPSDLEDMDLQEYNGEEDEDLSDVGEDEDEEEEEEPEFEEERKNARSSARRATSVTG